jgi:hypothetical protein
VACFRAALLPLSPYVVPVFIIVGALTPDSTCLGLCTAGRLSGACAWACYIPAYLPRATVLPLWGSQGYGEPMGCSCWMGTWMQPNCALGLPAVSLDPCAPHHHIPQLSRAKRPPGALGILTIELPQLGTSKGILEFSCSVGPSEVPSHSMGHTYPGDCYGGL